MTTKQTAAPADTSMMRIVHNALRRDLNRATDVLAATDPPDDRQRVAVARHVRWMMSFLEAHHRSEDAGLYPVLRERRPDAAALLDAMDLQHREIATAIAAVNEAAGTYEHDSSDAARFALREAIEALRTPLDAHLRQEEDDVLPIASACMTHEEWFAIEHEHNIKPKKMGELGFEGHWLIDDVDDADRATVLGVVPAVPRFLLLHGYARSYRRHRDACWYPNRQRRRVQHHGEVAVEVAVPLDAVWEVVRDPTRVGEWSHECVAAEYLDGADHAEVGARFRGRNRQGMFRWGRICEIVSVDPYELVWRTVPTTFSPDSSVWRIRLSATPGGTRIEQCFDVVKGAAILEVLYATILPAHRDRDAALEADLCRLADVAGHGIPDEPPHHERRTTVHRAASAQPGIGLVDRGPLPQVVDAGNRPDATR